MEIHESKKQLLQKEKSIFRRFSCLSFEEILYAYSYYLELRVRSEEKPHMSQNANGIYLAVNEFLKKIHEYRSQENQSNPKPSLQQVYDWLLEAEGVLNRIRIGQYKKGEMDTDDKLKNIHVLKLQETLIDFENKMYVGGYKEHRNIGENQELSVMDRAEITRGMVEERIDPNLEFITLKRINQEVIPYFYIRDCMIGSWESFPENALSETWTPVDSSIHKTLKKNFLRIPCKSLKAELDKLINQLKEDGIEIGDEPLQTLLTTLDSPELKKTASSFAFFQIGDYIYTNKRWLHGINMADHIFTDYWIKASKSEQKTFSDKYEQSIVHLLSTEDNGFAARSGVKYRKEGALYDIDIVACDASTIIFGEVKTTNIKDDYPAIISNIKNKLNGKASSQLRRLKQHLEDPEMLQQIGIQSNDMSTKEVCFMIFSMTPDGIGQSDEFLSVNRFLLEWMLNVRKENGVSLREAYDGLIKQMTYLGRSNGIITC